jgi:acryloyl-coenzyme A reductase
LKAVVQTGIGGPEVLKFETIPDPDPPQGDQVLVRTRACGVCYHDLLVRDGTYRRLVDPPLIPGHEIAGQVEAVGSLVKRFRPGDRVASLHREACGSCHFCRKNMEALCPNQVFLGHNQGLHAGGGYAEFAVIRESGLVSLPDAIPYEEGCVLSCAVGTEFHALYQVAKVRPGETVLVTGAGGGLGLHGIQLAKLAGARTFGLTHSLEKIAAIREAGADEVMSINDKQPLHQMITELAPKGIDVVCDNVGEPVFNACFRTLAAGGRYVFVGQINDRPISVNPARFIFNETSLMGSVASTRDDMDMVVQLVERRQVRPWIGSVMPISEAAAAHVAVATSASVGRVVLVH